MKKIEICDQEIQKQNARELLKRAGKIEKSGNPQAAVKCLHEAHAVLGEAWIREKTEWLQKKSLTMDVRRSAKEAVATGDYLKAAELYDRLISDGENEDMRLLKAVCLARGEAYEEAVSAFKASAPEKPVHQYDFGFALAKTERYAECLSIWDGIQSLDEGFLEQKSQVAVLLISDLYRAFEKREDLERLYKEGKYLVDAGYGNPELSGMVEQSMFLRIGEMWKKGNYSPLSA